jgi:hypothetical protein
VKVRIYTTREYGETRLRVTSGSITRADVNVQSALVTLTGRTTLRLSDVTALHALGITTTCWTCDKGAGWTPAELVEHVNDDEPALASALVEATA